MIEGKVDDGLEASIEIEIASFAGESRRVSVIVDTGYNGDLTLAESVVSSLNLPFAGLRLARLANDSQIILRS